MWVKGQSGNPRGRPKKGKSLTELLAEYGTRKIESNGKRVFLKELLAKALWQKALEGDVSAIKYIYDRVDGRPTESFMIPSLAENRESIRVVWVSADREGDREEEGGNAEDRVLTTNA